ALVLAVTFAATGSAADKGGRATAAGASVDREIDNAIQQYHGRKRQPGEQPSVRVIVRTAPGWHTQVVSHLGRNGGVLKQHHSSIHGFSATVHPDYLETLANHPGVLGVSLDARLGSSQLSLNSTTSTTYTSNSTPSSKWNSSNINKAPLWGGGTNSTDDLPDMLATLGLSQSSSVGSGVGVAIIDSGIRQCIEFVNPATGHSRIIAFYDFT